MPFQALPADATFDADQRTRSAYALADFFDGIVMGENYHRILRPSLVPDSDLEHLRPPPEPTHIGEVELCPYATKPTDAQGQIQLNIFAHAARTGSMPISLKQLRDWYELAKALQRPKSYLARIAAIGKLFKQQYEEGQPNTPQPFTGWTIDELEAWLWDLAVQKERQAQQKASSAAPPVLAPPSQMDLFG